MSCQNYRTVKLDQLSKIRYAGLYKSNQFILIQDKVDEEVDAGVKDKQEFGEGSENELPKLDNS